MLPGKHGRRVLGAQLGLDLFQSLERPVAPKVQVRVLHLGFRVGGHGIDAAPGALAEADGGGETRGQLLDPAVAADGVVGPAARQVRGEANVL